MKFSCRSRLSSRLKLPICFLAMVAAARALTVSSEVSVMPGAIPTSDTVVVLASGTLTLLKPGTYTVESWRLQGELRLAEAGSYILVATGSGGFTADRSSKITGIESTLTIVSAGPTQLGSTAVASLNITSTTPPTSLPIGPTPPPPLVNLSTLTSLAAGQTTTLGFVVGGHMNRIVLVRVVGPTLATFGVPNALATPTLALADGRGTILARNSGWSGSAGDAAVFFNVGAFPLPTGSKDAVFVANLSPGSYTVQVGGAGNGGQVLTEIYYVE